MCRQHPLLIPFVSMLSGLIGGQYLAVGLPVWVLLAALCLLAVAAGWGRNSLFHGVMAVVCCVWGILAIQAYRVDDGSPFAQLVASQAGTVTLEGIIASRPVRLPEGQRFELALERLTCADRALSVTARVLVTVAAGHGDWMTGDRIVMRGTIKIPRKLGLPGEFDYRRYLALKEIDATAWVPHERLVVTMRAAADRSLRRYLDQLAQGFDRTVRQVIPDPAVNTVLMALVTGNQLEIPPTLNAAYARAGVSHILSISGFHLAVISGAFVVLLVALGSRWEWFAVHCQVRRAALLATIPIMVVYLLFTGAAPATARSVVMVCAVVLAIWFERECELLDALLLAAFLLVLITPSVVFDLSFQLSFISLWGIVVLAPIMLRPLEKVLHGWQRTVATMLAASLAAVLATAVPVLSAFHQVSATGLLANLVVIPLLGYGAVLLGSVAVPLAIWLPQLAPLALYPAAWLIRLSNGFIQWIADLPVLQSYAVGPVDLLVSLVALAVLSFVADRRLKRLALIGLVMLLGAYHLWPQSTDNNRLRMVFLSVGQAEATLIRFPDNSTMLVDGGGYLHDTGRDFGERYLLPALHTLKVQRIDRLVLTHPHPDHLGGLAAVAEQLAVGEFWQGDWQGRGEDYQRLLRALRRQNVHVRRFTGYTPMAYAGTDLQLWAASGLSGGYADEVEAGNEESLVLRIQHRGFSALLMADAGLPVEQYLVSRNAVPPCTLLKVGHHGSRSASGEPFLDRLSPRYAVISVGYGNRFRLPSAEVLRRLARRGTQLYRTDLDGTVQVSSNGDDTIIKTHLEND